MRSMFFTPTAVLLEFEARFDRLLVLRGVVIKIVALGTL